MRAIATILRSATMLQRTAALGRCGVVALLALALVASTHARAGAQGTTSATGDALAQMATDALSQGVMAPVAWEARAALVGLGLAGLHLGAANGPGPRQRPGNLVRAAAYRVALPMAGAALGSLAACNGSCDGQQAAAEPLIGMLAGALVAHVLDPDTRPGARAGREHRATSAGSPGRAWAPVVSVGPGSYTAGIMGSF